MCMGKGKPSFTRHGAATALQPCYRERHPGMHGLMKGLTMYTTHSLSGSFRGSGGQQAASSGAPKFNRSPQLRSHGVDGSEGQWAA